MAEYVKQLDIGEGENAQSYTIKDAEARNLIEKLEAENEELKEQVTELESISNGTYDGRDLTEVFAGEIAGYSDEWAWIKARINANNFSGLRNGDYIPLTVNGERHEMQMNIDVYYKTTDNQLGHHIDFISRDCMSTTVQWNTENNNNGNASEAAPYMVSNLHNWLINTVYPMLPDSVKNVITTKRSLLERRYSSSGTLTDSTDWSWYDIGELWVPNEYEVFGSQVWSTKGLAAGQAMQYPIFANSYKNRMKGNGPNGDRCNWWLMNARSGISTASCDVSANGNEGGDSTSREYYAPLCFRIVAG